MVSATLDISEARLSHLRWEMALMGSINGTILPLDGHEKCQLGTWCRGDGLRRYGENKTFMVLQVAHKQFHRLASEIIELIADGAKHERPELLQKLKLVSQQVLFLLTSIELDSIGDECCGLITRLQLWIKHDKNIDCPGSENPTLAVNEARLIHLRWVRELQKTMSGGKRTIDIQAADDCSLGVWLRRASSTVAEWSTELEALDRAHKTFHELVETTISAVRKGNYREADYTYSRAYDHSAEVIMCLTRLELQQQG